MTPGTWTAFGRFLRPPADDMVFWAGTETAMQWPGYFDGAIRAGEQAADDVLQALATLPSPSEGSSVDSGGAGFADPASLGMCPDTPY